ncbi:MULTISPECIES: DUF3219 family protein [Bacillaceae]|uniref:DUF3219 family protein n=1 Tax=Bacillaceae TaxID=186817 RepID=UPI000BFE713E|nr:MULTISPECIES: DUF3219 family protein [Bacillaceae]PGT84399.1 DUF3219 domain-containing protein [Bacillus sp. AFS040349]UGB33019.1 YkvR family protein [Metabacillus sp. B2-18]
MVKEIYLNNKLLKITSYNEEITQNLLSVSIEFFVTSEEYHEITTILYENNFLVKVPEKEHSFQAIITNYSTSLTNLYEKGQVATFSLRLLEVKG